MNSDSQEEEFVRRAASERIAIVEYDPTWPVMFREESTLLRDILPVDLIGRIEHFGSTAVPGLAAKPIIDMLIEVRSLEETRVHIVPILTGRGYEYFWRPTIGEDPPFYAWFIKRNMKGERTHHLHLVEPDSELWERLYFRDYLRRFREEAERYEELKRSLAKAYDHDRAAYTKAKTEYIGALTTKARHYFTKPG